MKINKIGSSSYILVLILAIGAFYFFKTNSLQLPAPTGKYKVGVTAYHLIDTKRKEEFSPDSKAHRELMVYVWYPADENVKGKPYPYLRDILSQVKKGLSMFGYDNAEKKLSFLDTMETHSILECPISKAQAQYPVIFFLHGGMCIVRFYTALLEDLASHGYIVVGIDTTYESLVTKFPDGRIVDSDTKRIEKQYTDEERKKLPEHDLEVRDCRFVLNELEKINEYDSHGILTGRCDMDRVGIFGHSWGGFNALHACKADSRFKAGIDIDGGIWRSYHSKDLNIPFMIFSAYPRIKSDEELAKYKTQRIDNDLQRVRWLIAANTVFRNVGNDSYLAYIKGMEHFSFSDLELLMQENRPDSIAPLKGIAITRNVVLSFFDVYLKRSVGPQLIIDTIMRYPEIYLEAKINNKIEVIVSIPVQNKITKEALDEKQKGENEKLSALSEVSQNPFDFETLFDVSVYEFWKFNQKMAPNDMPLWCKNLQEYDIAKKALAGAKPDSKEYKNALSTLNKASTELKSLVNVWLDKRKLFDLVDILRRQSSPQVPEAPQAEQKKSTKKDKVRPVPKATARPEEVE